MTAVSFVVHGIPAPQGSKAPYGGESNPRTKPWRAAVTAAAAEAMDGVALLEGPLVMHVVFCFPRPKAHYRANGEMKSTAPAFHAIRPDADKLARAIGDALTGVVFHDDSQVSDLFVLKYYAEKASADVCVGEIERV